MVEGYREKVRSYREVSFILRCVLSGKAEYKQIASREKQVDDAWEVKLYNGLVYLVTSSGIYLLRRE